MSFIAFHRPHLEAEDRAAAAAVLEGGFLTMGAEVFAFEEALADMHGRAHAVMVNSCTNGHMLVFQYLRRVAGLAEGTPIHIPATTFAGPAFQAHHAGLHVVLADTAPQTGASDAALLLESAEAGSVLAPMPYAGVPLPGMSDLLEAAAKAAQIVVEDCAHAIGARYADGPAEGRLVGSLPTFASIFSFYPTKILNAAEGGVILTDDAALADWCRAARLHGVDRPVAGRYQNGSSDWEYALPIMGHKCNPGNIQAAIGRSQLRRLPRTLERLRTIAERYIVACDMAGLHPIDGQAQGNQHLFVLRDVDRARFLSHMQAHGVQCSVHYPPLWRMKAWERRSWELPGAELFSKGCVSLPIYAGLTDDEIERVCTALRGYPAA
ncbi:UDP-4-amino-4-deoxy-L-arabinose--oxoglutarate aminotransferase [Pseudoruegeria aquimaris]|uniref:UDP-4-amino-4-deoxy-L-arabinose--oxoglutarate aminotransferase n=1 Tax=Pseudoruegeria aquimaris TaxID=393663 RepID=A0A1Y5TMQ5_9RHOB|nr:DegT/DnrJ/EryC1/StrS aminotransferase family protein [Pseudoruegeria aquimaris]SLN67666.1 UDP-4-amino-4-deoxy-L-arabinose--oxoglutarate aminotransferase [Pseudoruegeria aquimaris]